MDRDQYGEQTKESSHPRKYFGGRKHRGHFFRKTRSIQDIRQMEVLSLDCEEVLINRREFTEKFDEARKGYLRNEPGQVIDASRKKGWHSHAKYHSCQPSEANRSRFQNIFPMETAADVKNSPCKNNLPKDKGNLVSEVQVPREKSYLGATSKVWRSGQQRWTGSSKSVVRESSNDVNTQKKDFDSSCSSNTEGKWKKKRHPKKFSKSVPDLTVDSLKYLERRELWASIRWNWIGRKFTKFTGQEIYKLYFETKFWLTLNYNTNVKQDSECRKDDFLGETFETIISDLPQGFRQKGDIRRTVRKVRTWELTDLGKQHLIQPQRGLEFTLMSYNLLAQNLLLDNLYLYRHCRRDVLEWEFRRNNLLREIREADVDIICLQELEEDQYNLFFKAQFDHMGYNGFYKRRTGNKKDGCAIFYRRFLFSLDTVQEVEYSREGIPALDRDNVGLIVILKPKFLSVTSSQRLCIATTHLLFSPRRGDVKLAQLRLLLAELDRLAYCGMDSDCVPQYHPIILCGDMNSEPHSPLYTFISRGNLKYTGLLSGDVSGQPEGANRGRLIPPEHILHLGIKETTQYDDLTRERLEQWQWGRASEGKDYYLSEDMQENTSVGYVSHRLNFLSAYSHVKHDGQDEVTTQHQKSSATVDYIFYGVQQKHSFQKHFKVRHSNVVEGPLQLLGTVNLMSGPEVLSCGGLPNAYQSSDHISLISKFLLRWPS